MTARLPDRTTNSQWIKLTAERKPTELIWFISAKDFLITSSR